MQDPDIDDDYGKEGFALDLFKLRVFTLDMTQQDFADRFGLSIGQLKDQEQGRAYPTRPFKVLAAAIELNPRLVARAARVAAEKWPNE